MAEVDISPLAKRLAEENNVDWRALTGSGEDGRIVERDVLDYLARVMAGDEAADPTPEPLPDGMEAWSDMPPSEFGGGTWSSIEPTGNSPDDSADLTSGSSEAASTAGDDDLLEVDTGEHEVSSSSGATDDWSSGDWGSNEWNDSGAAATASSGGAGSNGDASRDDVFAGVGELGSSEGSSGDGFDFGQDDGSFDFGQQPENRSYGFADDPSEERSGFDFGSGTGTDEDEFDLGEGSEAEETTSFGRSSGEDVSVFDTSSMEPTIDEGIFVFEDEDVPQQTDTAQADTAQTDTAQADIEQADTEHTSWEGQSATAAEVEQEVATSELAGEDTWQQEEDGSDLVASDAPWTAVTEEEGVDDHAVTFGATGFGPGDSSADDYDYLDRGDDALPEGVRIEEDEYRVVRSGVNGPAATATAVAVGSAASTVTAPAGGRGVVTAGIVLRRDVDLAPVIDATRALSLELGEEAPLVAFLLRAAVRAGQPWPLAAENSDVGLAVLSDSGVSVSVVARAGEMPFRDLVGACGQAGDPAKSPAIAVADVSMMGIDEAVLDLGMPVLTVGRVLEEESGRLHSTLTLSGLTTPESGSRFLGRVVELLSAPVRLVL